MEERSSDRYMTSGETAASLTRGELAMMRSFEAFERWSFFLHKSVSSTALNSQDVRLLHSLRMRGGAQNLSELLLFMNRNDVSTIQYSLRKIEQAGLIERIAGNSKREAGYQLTESGEKVTNDYASLREEILVSLVADVNGMVESLEGAAAALERLTGLYDQSTRTVLNRKILSR